MILVEIRYETKAWLFVLGNLKTFWKVAPYHQHEKHRHPFICTNLLMVIRESTENKLSNEVHIVFVRFFLEGAKLKEGIVKNCSF